MSVKLIKYNSLAINCDAVIYIITEIQDNIEDSVEIISALKSIKGGGTKKEKA